MATINYVCLAGNLTQDPELRRTSSGAAVSVLRLAVNESYTDKSGEKQTKTLYVDVQTWNRQAENCAKYLRKGSGVLLEGKLQYDQWESEGQKRSKIRVQARRVQFLDRAESKDSSPAVKPDFSNAPPPPDPDDDLSDWEPPF